MNCPGVRRPGRTSPPNSSPGPGEGVGEGNGCGRNGTLRRMRSGSRSQCTFLNGEPSRTIWHRRGFHPWCSRFFTNKVRAGPLEPWEGQTIAMEHFVQLQRSWPPAEDKNIAKT